MSNTTKAKFPTFAEVREAAQQVGWLNVYQRVAGNTLGHAAEKSPKHVCCPFHEDNNASFRFFSNSDRTGRAICTCGEFNDPFELVKMALNLQSDFEAMKLIGSELGLTTSTDENQPKPQEPVKRHAKKTPDNNTPEKIAYRRKRLTNAWKEAYPLTDARSTPAHRYFHNRGIPLGDKRPGKIRFHPNMDYMERKKVGDREKWVKTGSHPCILFVVQAPDGTLMTLHRIYITEDGQKADVPMVKMQMAPVIDGGMPGCSIRFGDEQNARYIAVAEGPETAWAVHLATGLPVRCTLNAALLASVVLPEEVTHVDIYGDFDSPKRNKRTGQTIPGAGQVKARELFNRLTATEKRKARLLLPAGKLDIGEKGPDWLDIIVNTEVLSHPKAIRVQTLHRFAA